VANLIGVSRQTLLLVLVLAIAAGVTSLGAAASGSSMAPVRTASNCVSRGGLPDLRCTPGAFNHNVKQRNIGRTICVSGWTDTVRPPTSYTNKLKAQGIKDYGFADANLSHYEEDHLIPLAVGGSPRSPKNLWPEPYSISAGARTKDRLERLLHNRVCKGQVRLAKARRAFRDWKAAFAEFF
jgi:hypothetical protein